MTFETLFNFLTPNKNTFTACPDTTEDQEDLP